MLDTTALNHLNSWQQQVQQWQESPVDLLRKCPYIIYAGGDDLFIVASWDLLPSLAHGIRREFGHYCHNRLTISGGIAIAQEKYPLYRAAELAGLALDQSKDRIVRGKGRLVESRKNALTFLGETLTWVELGYAWNLTEKLVRLLNGNSEGHKVPRAILQVLNYVAWLYRREADPEDTRSIKLGRWLWTLHYGLHRMLRRVHETLKEDLAAIPNHIFNPKQPGVTDNRLTQIETIQCGDDKQKQTENKLYSRLGAHLNEARYIHQSSIRYLGLPVRWAEFLTRKEVRSDGA